jgi:hypothetical protein
MYLKAAVRRDKTQAAQQTTDVSTSTARPGVRGREHDMGVLEKRSQDDCSVKKRGPLMLHADLA